MNLNLLQRRVLIITVNFQSQKKLDQLTGADYIKFQAFNADSLVKKGTKKLSINTKY